MYLTFSAGGASASEEDPKLDLSDLMDNDSNVVDEDTLHSMIVIQVAKWALEQVVSFDDVYPLYIYDAEIWDNDTSPRIDAGPESTTWTKEVAQFAWYVEKCSHVDKDQVFAYFNENQWKHINFDNLEDEVGDNYYTEFDGDYSDFAIQLMSGIGEEIPSHMEHYFDFEAYGESLISDYSQLEWNNRTFLYYQ